jgi:osmotically-inducible protein OsmY
VDTYAQKWAAEDATKRVNGVCAVAEDLTVKLLTNHKRTDSDIAMAVENALKWDVFVPKVVTAQVHDGAVSLEGEATWNFERDAAAMAVRRLAGVVSVFNGITLKPQVSATAVKERVQKALERQARTDTSAIMVVASGSTVTLSGNASSFQSTRDAANAAWGAPGVLQVVDRMTVSPTV